MTKEPFFHCSFVRIAKNKVSYCCRYSRYSSIFITFQFKILQTFITFFHLQSFLLLLKLLFISSDMLVGNSPRIVYKSYKFILLFFKIALYSAYKHPCILAFSFPPSAVMFVYKPTHSTLKSASFFATNVTLPQFSQCC